MKYTKKASTCLMAVALLTLLAAITASAAAPAINGRIVSRPLTPGDIKAYGLDPTLESSPGLTTVGIGNPVYLELQINSAIPPANIVSVTWVLTNRPDFSTAFLTSSPLGPNVPVYTPGDRQFYQVAGARKLLRADLRGQYTVVANIVTTSSGSASVTQTITASTYAGINICILCHSGSAVAPDKYTPWTNTAHAHIFTEGINGELLDSSGKPYYKQSCLACHTVGYNVNTNAIVNPINGGFDDIAARDHWSFPTVLAPTNWAYMKAVYPAVANLANIQCENCHGPGWDHFLGAGDVSLISKTLAAGDCNQCHDAPTHHIKGTEWLNSGHAAAVEETGSSCGRCHTGQGFINYVAGAPAVETPYEVITCATCHEPHSAANPHQLRTTAPVTLMDKKTTITTNTAGLGILCMNCHMSRQNATNYVEVTTGSNRYGPHHGPQSDMLMGVNAVNYGQVIPSSAHREVVKDSCVTCHMQTVTDTNILGHVGGHTFSPSWDTGTNVVELTAACAQCHGPISSFNFARQDYDGNGVVEGVQTEVKGLLSKLALLLPPVGVAKTSISIDASWTKPQLKAGYNYLFVQEDGSYGIHNLSYAVGLLKASIADLTGDSNSDSLPDWWQTQYFTSINSPAAAPNATPANDGVPNWMKYLLGLDPWKAGISVTNGLSIGVVWADGSSLQNPYGATNTVQIFTAAEVAFNTVQGKTYQIQAAASLSSGWQNVGAPIVGSGNAVSYVTPTRKDVKQFYRVYSY